MKKLLQIFVGFAIVAAMSFSNSKSEIRIKSEKVTINGLQVNKTWALSDFYEKLGKPERTRDGYNKTHTYDNLGIVLFEPLENKVPSAKVSEIQVYYNPAAVANDVTPLYGTTMPLWIDKLRVTSALTATEMLGALKKWNKTESYIEHSYRMANDKVYIYFQFNDAETGLIKVSIGENKRKETTTEEKKGKGKSESKTAGEKNIQIKGEAFKINKTVLNETWALSNFYELLGTPERTKDGYNKTHTYDNLGIVLFEKVNNNVPSSIVLEFQIYFNTSSGTSSTSPYYATNLNMVIDKLEINKSLTPSRMMEALKKWKKTDSYIEHSYRMARGKLYIYFQFNDSETGLLKVSIGENKK